MDGIGAVLFDRERLFPKAKVRLIKAMEFSYPFGLVERLRALGEEKIKLVELARLNQYLGELFAEAVINLLDEAKIKREEVALIGSHGQTVGHFPKATKFGRYLIRASVQLGESAIIAQRTGITTVSDFRAGAIAAGGEGAPILHICEYLLFSHSKKSRLVLNLGGIANFSIIPRSATMDTLIATDICPCNLLLDGIMRMWTKGRKAFDGEGIEARRGRVRNEWMGFMREGDFFKRPLPRSTGADDFGERYLYRLVRKISPGRAQDWRDFLRTAIWFIAGEIFFNYLFYAREGNIVDELVVSGGGVYNRVLLDDIRRRFEKKEVLVSDGLGIPAKFKEPICFGLLAELAIRGVEVPVSRDESGFFSSAIMGKIAWGSSFGFKYLRQRRVR